jgi:hypothetical protein
MRLVLAASLTLAVVIAVASSPLHAGQSAVGQAPVTFTKDVAPILQQNCQVCHRPNSIAPMSLLSYDEVRPWARSIRSQVVQRLMPPWHIEKTVGVRHFKNDRSLTDQQIDTITRWVDAGAPLGNPADMPPPRQFPPEDVWQIGDPDVIVELPQDYIVKAQAPDQWPDILTDPKLTQDRYIKGVQIIPTKGFTVVHHIRTSIVEPNDVTLGSGQTDDVDAIEVGEQGVFLNEYALGKQGDVFPDGSGRLIKAGTKINFQLHVHSNGKADTPANVKLGIKFYPPGYVPKHVISSMTVSAPQVDIRPHAENARSDGYKVLTKPTRILSFQPHMHNRGKAECLEAILPTGRVEVLSCAKFRFNWHINYVYDDDEAPLLPAGTVLHSIMWHDNSAKNPFNPDPDAQITYGQRTVDEMSSAWLSWYYMSDEDYQRELAERRARRNRPNATR